MLWLSKAGQQQAVVSCPSIKALLWRLVNEEGVQEKGVEQGVAALEQVLPVGFRLEWECFSADSGSVQLDSFCITALLQDVFIDIGWQKWSCECWTKFKAMNEFLGCSFLLSRLHPGQAEATYPAWAGSVLGPC